MLDINNDGFNDWIIAVQPETGSPVIQTWLGSANGWSSSSELTLPGPLFDYNINPDGIPVGNLQDMNGDGLVDYYQAYHHKRADNTVFYSKQTWLNTGDGFEVNTALRPLHYTVMILADGTVEAYDKYVDINGDGLPDQIRAMRRKTGTDARVTQLNTGSGWEVSTAYKLPGGLFSDHTIGTEGAYQGELIDINGDGLVDFIESAKISDAITRTRTYLNTGSGWSNSTAYQIPIPLMDYSVHDKGIPNAELVDVNGDGLLDVFQSVYIDGSPVDYRQSVYLNTGAGFVQADSYIPPARAFNVSETGVVYKYGELIDLNGDGQPEYVYNTRFQNSGTESFGIWEFNNGWQRNDAKYQEYLPNIPFYIHTAEHSVNVFNSADLDGDGQGEAFIATQLTNQAQTASYALPQAAQGTQAGYLHEHMNGLGIATRLTYGISTVPAVYTNGDVTDSANHYPDVYSNAPMVLVNQVRKMDGLVHPDAVYNDESSGWYRVDHHYAGLKANQLGRGSLGMQSHTITDDRHGVEIVSEYNQTWPHVGKTERVTNRLEGTMISQATTSFDQRDGDNGQSVFAYSSGSVSKSYDIKTAALVSETINNSVFDDWGNETQTTQTLKAVQGSEFYTTVKDTVYQTNEANWQLGLPTTITITKAGNDGTRPLDPHITQTTASYHLNGLVKDETLEPGRAQSIKTIYSYDDDFGNVTQTTVEAGGLSRSSQTTFSDDGRLPQTSSNALGHTATVSMDARWGQPKVQTDPNGLQKKFIYDAFGTVVREEVLWNGQESAAEIVLAKWCKGAVPACPTNGVYFVSSTDDVGESPQTVYYDAYGRELLRKTSGADLTDDGTSNGAVIYVATMYDQLGRKEAQSTPGANMANLLYHRIDYDVLGRAIKRIAIPVDGISAQTLIDYNGLTITTTVKNNSTADQISEVTNTLAGQPKVVKDAANNLTRYEYDINGNLTKTIDAYSNSIVLGYDHFSRKISMDDPDMGIWSYEYDAFGNLIQQTDAKLQVTLMQYDELNRLITRTEKTGLSGQIKDITTWTYDDSVLGSTTKKALGLLHKVTSSGTNYERIHYYDESGRPIKEQTVVDGKTFNSERDYFRASERVAWEKYPSGLTLTKDYDATGFPLKLRGVDLAKFDDYLDTYHSAQTLFKDAEQIKEDHQAELDRLQTLIEGPIGSDGETRSGGLNDQIKPFADAINKEVANAQNWQGYLNETALVLNEHLAWYNHYFNVYKNSYETPYNTAIAAANAKYTDANNLSDDIESAQNRGFDYDGRATTHWRNADDRYSNYEAEIRSADAHWQAILDQFRNLCTNNPERVALGKEECQIRSGNSQADADFAYSWISKHLDWKSNDETQAQGWLNKYYQEVNNAKADDNEAAKAFAQRDTLIAQQNTLISQGNSIAASANTTYGEGLDIYLALSSSHLNVFKGFEKRYNYYDDKYEDYVGDYECTKTADIDHAYRTGNTVTYKAPASGWTRRNLDMDNDGTTEKWDIHYASQRLKRAEEIPQYKKGNCKTGELYAKVGDGRIDQANQALISSNLLYERDYLLYLHQIEIDPVNTAIELANTEYELSEQKKTAYQSSSTVYWEALAYSADGQIEKAKYGNNVVSSWDYDERGRTTLIKAGKTGQFDELQKMVFDYDRIGNLISRTDITNDLTETFSYDILNRVEGSTMNGTAATAYQQVGLENQAFSYDAIGNITNKSDVGAYTYGANGAGVHAVTSTTGDITTTFSYDANGNQLTGYGRSIDWSIFNKPVKITKNGSESRFAYGPERQMISQFEQVGDQSRYTRYIGGRYEEITFNQTTEAVHHLKVAGHTVAVLKTQPQLNDPDITLPIVNSTHYLHQDHLDSVVMITDANGGVVEKNHYDAFGKKRTGVIEPNAAPLLAGIWPTTDRGFTNHMELVGVGLIHMKGRVYDATFGRFLSADPHIQSPLNSQSLNRYSYVQNNPLSLTDPSGYFWSKLKKLFKKILKAIKRIVKKIVAIVKKVVKAVWEISKYPRMKIHRWLKRNSSFYAKYYRQIAAIAVSIVTAGAASAALAGVGWATTAAGGLTTLGSIAVGAVSGFTAGFVATGSLKGALIGGLTGAAFGAVGAKFGKVTGNLKDLGSWGKTILKATSNLGVGATKAVFYSAQALAHGVVGGLSSRLNGGSFSKGILTSFVNKLATPSLVNIAGDNQALVIAGSGLIAGGVSVLAGGSFGDGALLGVMATVLNNYSGDIKNFLKNAWESTKWVASGIRIGAFGKFKFFGIGFTVDAGSFKPFDPETYENGNIKHEQQVDLLGFGIKREGENGNYRNNQADPFDAKEWDAGAVGWEGNPNGGVDAELGGGLLIGWDKPIEVIPPVY